MLSQAQTWPPRPGFCDTSLCFLHASLTLHLSTQLLGQSVFCSGHHMPGWLHRWVTFTFFWEGSTKEIFFYLTIQDRNRHKITKTKMIRNNIYLDDMRCILIFSVLSHFYFFKCWPRPTKSKFQNPIMGHRLILKKTAFICAWGEHNHSSHTFPKRIGEWYPNLKNH